MLLAPWAAASTSVDDQDMTASLRVLNTGDWSARMRTVHELEYLQEAAIPALSVAAVDGDWQVRMAAVHALAFLGPKATPIMQNVLKNERCPVVRLITLHNLGGAADEGAEDRAMGWIFSASNAQLNDCRDQPAPGHAAWAASVVRRIPAAPAAAVFRTVARVTAKTAASPVSKDGPLTPDIPKPARTPPAPKIVASPEAPTKSARYAELDALLSETTGPKEALSGAPKIEPRSSASIPAPSAAATGARPDASSAPASPRRAGTPEVLPKPVAAPPSPDRSSEVPVEFEAAGSKAPHDALPDLLAALKSGDAKTRSRAADQLGSSGAAASAAVPALMTALRDRSPRVRASASLALGNIGASDAGVVPLLVNALKDKNVDVRYASALALSRIKTPAARAAFEKHIGEDARRAIEQPQP
jgi:HEAT repeat protein